MKSKIKRHSRSVMSVILTISMLISTMMVGLIATDAARVGDEEVGSSDSTITDYFFKGSFDNWKKHNVNSSGDASIDISIAGTYEFVLVTGGGTQRRADKTFTKTEEYNTHEDSSNFKITVPEGKTGTYTFHTSYMSNNSVTVKVTFPSGGGTTNDWKLLDGTNNWSTSSTSKQFTLNSATGFYEYSQYFTGDNYFRIANGTTQYQGITGNQDTDIAANADWTALIGNSNNAFKFSPSAAGTYIIQVDAANTQVKIIPATKYTITFNAPTNGTLTSSAANAYAGDTVTLTATPDANYTLKSLILNYDDTDHDVTSSVEDNKYTFTMPAYAVTATATYTNAKTIYFNNYETKWTKVFAYTKNSSDGTEGNGASPGMEMTRVGTSSIYKVEVPSDMDTIIFTGSGGANNSGATITCNNQTIGNSLPGDTTYNEYKATKADATTGTWSKHVDRNNVYTVTPGTSVTTGSNLYYKGLKATLYDYYTDGEYNNGTPKWIEGIKEHSNGRDAEYSRSNSGEYLWNPYKTFDTALSKYAADKSITYPLYFGNLNITGTSEYFLEYETGNENIFTNWSYKVNNSAKVKPNTTSVTGLAGDTESNSTITHSGGTVPMAMFDEDWLSKENSTGNPLATILNSTGFPVRKLTKSGAMNYVVFDKNGKWDGTNIWAWMWETGKDGKWVQFTYDSSSGYYLAPAENYDYMNIFSLNSDPADVNDYGTPSIKHRDNAVTSGISITKADYSLLQLSAYNAASFTTNTNSPARVGAGYTYYEYDSTNGKDNAYIQNVTTNDKTATIEYSTTDKVYSSGDNGSGSTAGFFPFDNMTGDITNNHVNGTAHDLGFGMKLEIPFSLNENGTVDGTANGIAQTFNFSGDDDLWVYVDGHLVLDLGGAHYKAEGSINFKDRIATSTTKKVDAATAAASTENNATLTATETYSNDFSSASWFDTNPETMHTMTLYYMERGMYDSNLKFDFSFHAVQNLYTTEKKIRTSGTEQVKINSGFYDHYKDTTTGYTTDYIEDKMTKFEKSYQDEVFNFDHKVSSDGTTYAYPARGFDYSKAVTTWDSTGEHKSTQSQTYTTGSALSYSLTNDDKAQFNGKFTTGTHFQITETAAQGNKYKYTPKLTVYDDTESGREQYFNVQNVGTGAYTFAFDQDDEVESQVVNVRARFENQMKQHTLTIKKNVTGQTTDGDFTFKVLFNFAYEDSGVADNGYEPYPLYISSDNDDTKEKLNADGSMTIKNGETITIKGIPEGADFKIIEESTAANYVYGSISATGATPTNVSGENAVTMTMGESDINATITNVYNVVNATIRIKYAPTYYDFANNITANIQSEAYKSNDGGTTYTNEGNTIGCHTTFEDITGATVTNNQYTMVQETTRDTSNPFSVSIADLNATGKLFIGWYDENGNRYNDTSDSTHHSTTASATRAKDRVFEARFIDAPTYRIDYTVPTRLWGNRVYKAFGKITNAMIDNGSVGYDSSRTVTETVDQRYYLAAKIVNDNKPKEEIFLKNITWGTVGSDAGATTYNVSKTVTKNASGNVEDVIETGNVTYNLYRSLNATATVKQVTVNMFNDCSAPNTMTTSYEVDYGSSVNNNETEAINIPEGKTFYRWRIETLNSLGGTDDETLVTYDYSKNFNYVAYDNYKVTAEIIEKKGGKDYNPYTAGKEGDPYSADVAPANTTSVINLGQTRSHWNDTSTGVKYTPGEGESTQRTNANCDYDRLFIDLALSYSDGEQKLNTLDNLKVGFIIEYYNTTTQQWEVFKSVSFSSKELGDKNRIEYYYGFMNSPELREVDLHVTPTIGGVKSGNTLAFNFKDAKFS